MCAQGFKSYFGFEEEGTQGAATVSPWGNATAGHLASYMYFDSESMAPANEQRFLEELGKSGTMDRAIQRFRMLGEKCEGSVTFTVYPEGGSDKGGIGTLLKHLMGNVSPCEVASTEYGTTGTYSGLGTFLHTYTPKDDMIAFLSGGTGTGGNSMNAYGLGVHIGREDAVGTIQDYPYLGCRIRSINFSCAAGEELKCTVDFVGRIAKDATTTKSPSFSTTTPFLWSHADFEMGATEAGASGTDRAIDAFSITIANNFVESWVLGTNVLGRVRPSGFRTVTGSYTTPYEAWVETEFQKWRAGTTSACRIKFTNGPYILEFRLPDIRYTGNPPSVGSPGELMVEMPFQAMKKTNFDIKVLLVNTDEITGFDRS